MVDDEEIPFSDTLLEEEAAVPFSSENLADMTEDDTEKDTDFISLSEALGIEPRPKTQTSKEPNDIIRVYRFTSLNQLSILSEQLLNQYRGKNTAYRNKAAGEYYLILHKSNHTPDDFSKICNTVSEYGIPVRSTPASTFFYEEHYETLIRDNALQILGKM